MDLLILPTKAELKIVDAIIAAAPAAVAIQIEFHAVIFPPVDARISLGLIDGNFDQQVKTLAVIEQPKLTGKIRWRNRAADQRSGDRVDGSVGPDAIDRAIDGGRGRGAEDAGGVGITRLRRFRG